MKKTLTIMLAVLMLAAIVTIPVIADTQTTTLTTTVPAAEYTMTVPETLEIDFGSVSKEIGKVMVGARSGFEIGKNVEVTVSHDDFTAEGVITTIPYSLGAKVCGSGNNENITENAKFTNHTLVFKTTSTNKIVPVASSGKTTFRVDNNAQSYDYYACKIYAYFSADDWGKALAGDYTTTITFVAEIVAEEAAE